MSLRMVFSSAAPLAASCGAGVWALVSEKQAMQMIAKAKFPPCWLSVRTFSR